MSEIQLDDLFITYPFQDEPGFQTKFTSKYEFLECASLPSEPTPKRGEFYNAQKLIHRALREYDNMLIIWRTGTGKTGSAGGKAEEIRQHTDMFKDQDYIEMYTNKYATNIKRCVYLVRGKVLAEEVKNQLLHRYSQPTEHEEHRLSKFFKIYTYFKFASLFIGLTDEQIKKEWSDTIFILDEGHNTRIDPSEGLYIKKTLKPGKESKQRRQAMTYQILHRVFHVVERSKKIIMTATPMINDSWEIMDIMNLILPLDKQMKFPTSEFVNKTIEELEPYFRGKVSYLRESGINVFASYDHEGMILKQAKHIISKSDGRKESYQSIQKIYAVKMDIIPDESDPATFNEQTTQPVKLLTESGEITVYPQGNIYRKHAESIRLPIEDFDPFKDRPAGIDIITKGIDTVENPREFSKHSFYHKERDLANAIYPDGSYGSDGFSKYIQVIDEKNDVYKANPTLLAFIKCKEKSTVSRGEYIPFREKFDATLLRYLSCKYAKIVELVYDSYYGPETEDDIKGTSYAYIHWLKGSGAIYLGLCLQANGIDQLVTSRPFFEDGMIRDITELDEDIPVDMSKRKSRRIRKDFIKAPRYAILHSGMSAEAFRSTIELYNSWENRHGEYLKLLIYTPIGREGFNLFNSTRFYGIDRGWNRADEYQASSRGIRAISHDDLLEERSKRGLDPIIKVKFYPFAAYDPISKTSIDIKLFDLSERKDIYIKMDERYIKRITIDQIINKERNQRPDDQRGSPTCDYQECEYESYDPAPNTIDYTSYDLLYSDEAVADIISNIRTIFKTRFEITISDLISYFAKLIKDGDKSKHIYRPNLIYLSIYKIINEKIYLINKYGYRCYLLEYKGTLYIQTDYPFYQVSEDQSSDVVYYTRHLVSTVTNELDIYIYRKNNLEKGNLLAKLTSVGPQSPEFDKLFNELDIKEKILMIEEAFYKYIKGDTSGLVLKIVSMNEKYIMKMYEPLEELRDTAYAMKNVNSEGPGRLTKYAEKSKKVQEPLPVPSDAKVSPYQTPRGEIVGPIVYLHNLYGQLNSDSYSATTSFQNVKGKIRIFIPTKEDYWRDVSIYEKIVYSKHIKQIRSQDLSKYESKDIYGLILKSDPKFRIVAKFMQNEKSTGDKRHVFRGRDCETIKKDKLILISIKLGITYKLPSYKLPSLNEMRDYFVKSKSPLKLDKISDTDLPEYYIVYTKNIKRDILCERIRKKLEETDSVYIE